MKKQVTKLTKGKILQNYHSSNPTDLNYMDIYSNILYVFELITGHAK